jgi:hypothetical protein
MPRSVHGEAGNEAWEAPPPIAFFAFNDGRQAVLVSDLRYRILETEFVVTVPAGFVTDFASTPRAIWAVIPPFGNYQRAAVIHDYLYWTQICTREQADLILRLAMFESGVKPFNREVIYRAVRKFGKSAWDTNSDEKRRGLSRFVPRVGVASMIEPVSQIKVEEGPGSILRVGALDTWEEYRMRVKDADINTDPEPPLSSEYCSVVERIWTEGQME